MPQPHCSACQAPLKSTTKFCPICGQRVIIHGAVDISGGTAYGPAVGDNITTYNIQQEAARAVVTALHSIPEPPTDFTGRTLACCHNHVG